MVLKVLLIQKYSYFLKPHSTEWYHAFKHQLVWWLNWYSSLIFYYIFRVGFSFLTEIWVGLGWMFLTLANVHGLNSALFLFAFAFLFFPFLSFFNYKALPTCTGSFWGTQHNLKILGSHSVLRVVGPSQTELETWDIFVCSGTALVSFWTSLCSHHSPDVVTFHYSYQRQEGRSSFLP